MNLVPLNEYAAVINDAYDAANQCANHAIGHARVAGEHLIKAKEAMKHGEWLPWLKANVRMSERTARAYMSIAQNWGAISAKSAESADLTIDSALKALAKPKTEAHIEPSRPAVLSEQAPPRKEAPQSDEPDEVSKLREQLADREERLSEMASQQQEMHEELTFLQKVEDAGDQLATALAEVKRQQAEIRILKERINGLMNEKNEAVRAAKMWKAKYEKAAK